MEALFGLYDALEASAQEGLAAPPEGADAAAVAAAGVQLLDELRTRFARLVLRLNLFMACSGSGVGAQKDLVYGRSGVAEEECFCLRILSVLSCVHKGGCALLRQAVGDTWDKTPEQGPLRLMALKRIFKYYVRPCSHCCCICRPLAHDMFLHLCFQPNEVKNLQVMVLFAGCSATLVR